MPHLIKSRPILSEAEFVAHCRRLFYYDPATGVITRLIEAGGQMPGKAVGTKRKDFYMATRTADKEILCHRLAWVLFYGEIPTAEIDHINGRRDDNRILNLRQVDRTHNNQNRRTAHKNNVLGVLGVRQDGTKFLSRIRVNKKLIRLGRFETVEAASAAFLAAKRKLHEGNTL